MARHKHADLIIAKAEDDSLEIQIYYDNEWVDIHNPSFSPKWEYRIKPKPHLHQDLMDLQKSHPDIVFEVRNPIYVSEVWHHAPFPDWSEDLVYRVKPTPHKHQALMDAYEADPTLEFQYKYSTAVNWRDCTRQSWHGGGKFCSPNWDEETEYRIKPKEVKLTEKWLWIVSERGEKEAYNSNHFYTESEAAKFFRSSIITKAPWTRILVNDETGEITT